MRCRPSTIAAAIFVARLAHAYAQTPPSPDSQPAGTGPDETVTVTATRVATPADDVPAGVSVLDAGQMALAGDETLADALAALPGMHLVQTGGPGSQASLFIRGADSDQVQVMIDGVPVNDPSGPGGAYDFGVETLSDVSRIEVVRGPMSALYGSGAVGGVVNIVTDRGSSPFGASATVAGGAPASLLAQGSAHGTRGAFDYAASVEGYSDRGYDDTPQRESVYTGKVNGFRSQVASGTLGYTPVAGTRVFVDLRGRASVTSYDEQGYPAYDGNNNTGRDNDFFVRGGLDSVLADGWWRTGALISYNQEYRHYVTLLQADDPNQQQDNSRYTGERLDVQWNNTLRLPDTAWSRAGTLSAGYEHSTDTAQERLDSVYSGVPYTARVDASDQRNSVYAGVQDRLFGRAVVSANVRQEWVSGVGQAFTWRAGVSYWLAVLATHVKASYGTAFLAPSLYDRYGVDDDGYVGNPGLKPERSRSYEVGTVTRLGERLSLSATYFHTDTRDLITTEFAPVYTSVNVAAARMQGVETELEVRAAPWLTVAGTYTYTDARDAMTGQLLLRRPYDQGALTLTLTPTDRLTVVPRLEVVGGDLDELVDDQGYTTGVGRNGGGAILDLNATYVVTPRWRVFVWGKNLNNSRYEEASGYAMPGPSFLAGVRASY
jgi:vitamin B12 transporter